MYAGVHAVHHGYHRLLSKRFPFAVYYRIEDAWLESAPFWTAVVIRSGLKTA
jgi:hypothetical protein